MQILLSFSRIRIVKLAVGMMLVSASINNIAVASQQRCETIDLRPEMGAPWDQGGTGWCYAFTAAQLVSFKLKKKVSAFDLALQANFSSIEDLKNLQDPRVQNYLKINADIFEQIQETRGLESKRLQPSKILRPSGFLEVGGEEHHAILMANTKGFCLESSLSSQEKAMKKIFSIANKKWLSSEKKVKSEMLQTPKNLGILKDLRAKRAIKALVDEANLRCGLRLQPPEPLLPLSVLAAEDIAGLRRAFPTKKSRVWNRKRMFSYIDEALDQRRPVTIGYDGNEVQENANDGESGEHSSLIVARKKMGGSCYYFIRDSYGKTCEQYRTKFSSRCEKSQGGLWVKESELNSIYSVIQLK